MFKPLTVSVFALLVVSFAIPAAAHEPHECPPGFNDEPALPGHVQQQDITSGKLSFDDVFGAGQRLFITNFNACDGAGRPGSTGGGAPRPIDPVSRPRFTRVSAPETNSCAGCHAQPQPGGAGDIVANVFVLAQTVDPVSKV